jgi:hypothetical protein
MLGLFRVMIAAGAVAAALLLPAGGQAGSGAALAWSPTTSSGTYDYGTLDVGASQTKSVLFTLSNSGAMASGTLTINLSGPAAFTITNDTCPGLSLSGKKSCGVTVKYAPATGGETDNATLTATGEHGAGASITLTGKGGSADLSLSPGTPTGTTATGTKEYSFNNGGGTGGWEQTFTVTNNGNAASNTLQVQGGRVQFHVISDTCSTNVLAASGTCTIEIEFAAIDCNEGDQLSQEIDVNTQDNLTPYIALTVSGICERF